MNDAMTTEEILKFLPHRYPFILIDRIVEINPSKSLIAIKNVTINEHYFVGHFPNKPIMPGVIIIEALAQAGAILAYKTLNTSPKDGVLFLFAGIDKARFRRVVVPGDQLRLEVKVLRMRNELWKLEGFAYVGDQLACAAEFMSVSQVLEEPL